MKLVKYILFAILFTISVKAQNNVVSYPAHTFDCTNTTSETTIFLDTLSSGAWTNAAFVTLNFTDYSKQNSGSNATLTIRVKIDGQTITTLNASVIPSNATEGWCWRGIAMKRQNDTVACYVSSGAPTIFTLGLSQAFISTNSFANQFLTGLNFGTDKVIEVTAQWSVANANIYIKASDGKLILTP